MWHRWIHVVQATEPHVISQLYHGVIIFSPTHFLWNGVSVCVKPLCFSIFCLVICISSPNCPKGEMAQNDHHVFALSLSDSYTWLILGWRRLMNAVVVHVVVKQICMHYHKHHIWIALLSEETVVCQAAGMTRLHVLCMTQCIKVHRKWQSLRD